MISHFFKKKNSPHQVKGVVGSTQKKNWPEFGGAAKDSPKKKEPVRRFWKVIPSKMAFLWNKRD